MRLGRMHLHGPHAWPDSLLAWNGSLLFGAAAQLRSWVLGGELHCKRGWNPWVAIYVGWWAFEIYFDRDRSFDE